MTLSNSESSANNLNKMIIIFLIALFLLLVTAQWASAGLGDNLTHAYNFTSNANDSIGVINGTINYATNSGTSPINGNYYEYDGNNDWIDYDDAMINTSSEFSVGVWIQDYTDNGDGEFPLGDYTGSSKGGCSIRINGGTNNLDLLCSTGAGIACIINNDTMFTSLTESGWHLLVYGHDGSTCKMSLDNVTFATESISGSVADGEGGFRVGARNVYDDYDFDGDMDELYIYDRMLTQSEVGNMYNSGSGNFSPYGNVTPPNVTSSNRSLERTTSFEQSADITSSSTSYIDIVVGDVNVTNETEAYITFTANTQKDGVSGADNITCRITVNDTDYDTETTRTNGASGAYGSWYIKSSPFNITGENEIKLECKGSGGSYVLSNSHGIIHYMIDSNEVEIAHQYYNASHTFNSLNWEVVDEFNYTVQSENISESDEITLIFDMQNEFSYNSSTRFSYLVEIDGSNSTEMRRSVNDSTGIGANFFKRNVSENTTINIKVYGKSTDQDGTMAYSGVLKEFINNPGEIEYNTDKVTPIGGTYVTQQTNTLTNVDNMDNIIYQSAISVSDITAIDKMDFIATLTLANGTERNSSEISRTISTTGDYGVVILQYEWSDVSNTNNTIELKVKRDNASGFIYNINSIMYYSEQFALDETGFNITTYNEWDNSSISNFTAYLSDGRTISTTDSYIFVSTDDAALNITIETDNYFNTTVLNHNTSTNLNQSMFQSEVTFAAYELFTINTLNTTIFNISGVEKNTTEYFHLKVGSYNVTAHTPGYYDKTQEFTITAFQNDTQNISDIYNAIANFTLHAYGSGDLVTNFTLNGVDFTYSNSTTTGFLGVPTLQNTTKLIDISSSGYATIVNYSFAPNSSLQLYNLTIYAYNSILVSIYNETDLTLIDDQNVTIYVIEDAINSSINTTETGQLYLTLLAPDDYEIRFSADGFTPISKFVTVTADSTQNFSVYMQENVSTELQIIEVYDTTSTAVEGAVVWLQREQINTTPLYLTVQEAETNSEGKTAVFVERDTEVYYRFAIIVDGEAVPIEPNQNYFTTPTFFVPGIDETIRLIVNLEGGTPDYIADRISLVSTLNWTDSTNTTANFTWINGGNSISGATLKLYGKYLNSSLAYEFISENSSSESSGDLTLNVPEINNTIFKVVAYVTFNDEEVEVDTLFRSWDITEIVDKYMGLFLSAIIVIFAAFGTLGLGALASSCITFGLLVILAIIGFLQIPLGIITGFIALCVIVFIKTRRS